MGEKQFSGIAVKTMGGEETSFLPKNAKHPFSPTIFGTKKRSYRLLYSLVPGLLLLGAFLFKFSTSIVNFKYNSPKFPPGFPRHAQCPQVEPLSPKHTSLELDEMDDWLSSEDYSKISAKLLSKAITYQTVSYESMGNPDLSLEDPLYDPFKQFYEDFISVEFPNLTAALDLQRVNEHGLLYTWTGSDPDLKPVLLMAR